MKASPLGPRPESGKQSHTVITSSFGTIGFRQSAAKTSYGEPEASVWGGCVLPTHGFRGLRRFALVAALAVLVTSGSPLWSVFSPFEGGVALAQDGGAGGNGGGVESEPKPGELAAGEKHTKAFFDSYLGDPKGGAFLELVFEQLRGPESQMMFAVMRESFIDRLGDYERAGKVLSQRAGMSPKGRIVETKLELEFSKTKTEGTVVILQLEDGGWLVADFSIESVEKKFIPSEESAREFAADAVRAYQRGQEAWVAAFPKVLQAEIRTSFPSLEKLVGTIESSRVVTVGQGALGYLVAVAAKTDTGEHTLQFIVAPVMGGWALLGMTIEPPQQDP